MLSPEKKIAWKLKQSKENRPPKVTPPSPTFTSQKALAFLGMIITLLAMVRIPYVGQFFDDVLFSLPFGWLKYLVYAMTFYFLGRVAFNYKLHPIFAKYTLAHIILFTGLAWLFSYLSAPFIESQYAYDVIGMELFSKFLGSWYENSVFNAPSIEISGFFLNTMGGGLIGYAIHSVTSYSTAIGSLILSLSFISLAISIYLTGSIFGFAKITMRKIREKRELRRTKQSTYVMENQKDEPEPVISNPLSAEVASRVQKIVTNPHSQPAQLKQPRTFNKPRSMASYHGTTQLRSATPPPVSKPKPLAKPSLVDADAKASANDLFDKEKLAMTLERLALHKSMARNLDKPEKAVPTCKKNNLPKNDSSSIVATFDLSSATPKMNPFGVPLKSKSSTQSIPLKKLVIPKRDLFINLAKHFRGQYVSPSLNVFAPAKELEQHRIDINRHHHLVKVRDISEFLNKRHIAVQLRNRRENYLFYQLEFTFRSAVNGEFKTALKELAVAFKKVSLRSYLAPKSGNLIVEISKQIPTNITFNNLNLPLTQETKLVLPIGKDCTGENVSVDLTTANGLLFLGASKEARNNLVKQFLTSLIYTYSPYQLQLIIAGEEGDDLAIFTAAQQAIANIIKTREQLTKTITLLDNEISRREKLLMDQGVSSLAAYNKKVDKTAYIPAVVLVASEVATWRIDSAIGEKFNNLLLKGSQLGIYLVLGSCQATSGFVRGLQMKPMAKVYGGEIPSLLSLTQNLLPANDVVIQLSATSLPVRAQTPVVTAREINRLLVSATASEQVVSKPVAEASKPTKIKKTVVNAPPQTPDPSPIDHLGEQIKKFVIKTHQASIPLIQQQFNLGYMQAIEYLEALVKSGIVKKNSVTNTYKVAF